MFRSNLANRASTVQVIDPIDRYLECTVIVPGGSIIHELYTGVKMKGESSMCVKVSASLSL